EAVVGELQALLRAVRPQVPVHARGHRLAVLVRARAPAVVPHAPELGLLPEADDLAAIGPRAAGGIASAQLGQAAGAGAEDGDTLGHGVCHLLSRHAPFAAWPGAERRAGTRRRGRRVDIPEAHGSPAAAGCTRWIAGMERGTPDRS